MPKRRQPSLKDEGWNDLGFSLFVSKKSLRDYERGVIRDDNKRFRALVTNDLDQDPEVTAWLETLSDDEKAELGL